MNICTICKKEFESESPAVLFVSRYGSKRVLCEECERLLDLASAKEDSKEKTEAKEALTALATYMKDNDAVDVLRDVLNGKTSAELTEEDLAAEEEWLEENAEEEEKEDSKATWFDYALPIATGILFVVFMLWFIFFR